MTETVDSAIEALRKHSIKGTVETAILLSGSSGSPADTLSDVVSVPYAELPGFPKEPGTGRLVVGTLEGARIAILEGRSTFHESGDAGAMRVPLETVARMGARIALVATSAVSLQGDWYPGSVAIVSDHINFCGVDPLVGVASANRLVSMRDAHDQRLRRRLKIVASLAGVTVQEGVYFAMPGPSGETLAEARMAKTLGADLIGHGLAAEVILARWLGMRVAALTVVSGFATGVGAATAIKSAQEGAIAGSIGLRRLLRAFLRPAEE